MSPAACAWRRSWSRTPRTPARSATILNSRDSQSGLSGRPKGRRTQGRGPRRRSRVGGCAGLPCPALVLLRHRVHPASRGSCRTISRGCTWWRVGCGRDRHATVASQYTRGTTDSSATICRIVQRDRERFGFVDVVTGATPRWSDRACPAAVQCGHGNGSGITLATGPRVSASRQSRCCCATGFIQRYGALAGRQAGRGCTRSVHWR